MIHNLDGSRKAIPYGKQDQHINSISRNHLNKLLLNIAEQFPNVRLHFNQKLDSIDFSVNECRFVSSDVSRNKEKDLQSSKDNFELYTKESTESDSSNSQNNVEEIVVQPDLIIGADGAFSKVRNQMMRQTKFNYKQMYIDHGYLELTIPSKKVINPQTRELQDGFAMEENYLHIWPRGEFMMIALPNQNKTFTVTLFMPFKNFEKITNQWELIEFFKTHFPDSIQLIGRDELVDTFFSNKPSALITIKCSPYNLNGRLTMIRKF